MDVTNQQLYSKVIQLLNEARQNVAQTINNTMAMAYFEVGKMIVEEEQKGEEKAEYGKRVLKELSEKLISEFGKGFSFRNLEQIRQFYLTYSITQTVSAQLEKSQTVADEFKNDEIPKTISRKSTNPIQQTLSAQFKLTRSQSLI
ncbi:DUF1016 family protein [Pedobacter frigidisoli]|uniref:DUF1016 family protein n=1 Tax=Pedobacter frigidisoli TaxID=2530455 RepID=A0A4R0P4L2_9SPHI|nr:DUF1016 N-terminal domain-containing protein [Pedobacter frigidisoli]TCD10254.1 DUF1016 family protein [Pedobacter frigidisoli]